jgi:hypothetical protein
LAISTQKILIIPREADGNRRKRSSLRGGPGEAIRPEPALERSEGWQSWFDGYKTISLAIQRRVKKLRQAILDIIGTLLFCHPERSEGSLWRLFCNSSQSFLSTPIRVAILVGWLQS